MVQRLTSSDPQSAFLLHQLQGQVSGVWRYRFLDACRKINFVCRGDLCPHSLLVITWDVEGMPTGEQLAENDANAEYVSLLVVVPFQHFWSHVVRCSSLLHHHLSVVPRDEVPSLQARDQSHQLADCAALRHLHFSGLFLDLQGEVRQAEVNDFQGRIGAPVHKEDVLGLDVPVDDAQIMTILRGRKYLFHHEGRLALRNRFSQPFVVVQNAREEVAALAKLGDEEDIPEPALATLLVVDLVHCHNVGMVQGLQQSHLRIDEFSLKSRLYRNVLTSSHLLRLPVSHDHHLAESTSADIAEKLVVVENS